MRPRVQFFVVDPHDHDAESYALCSACGYVADSESCGRCGGDGVTDHDCGEDSCACTDPEDNVPCDECDGRGLHWRCTGGCGYLVGPELPR